MNLGQLLPFCHQIPIGLYLRSYNLFHKKNGNGKEIRLNNVLERSGGGGGIFVCVDNSADIKFVRIPASLISFLIDHNTAPQ